MYLNCKPVKLGQVFFFFCYVLAKPAQIVSIIIIAENGMNRGRKEESLVDILFIYLFILGGAMSTVSVVTTTTGRNVTLWYNILLILYNIL